MFCRRCNKLVTERSAVKGKFCPECGRALTWFGQEKVDISEPLIRAILARKNYLLKQQLQKIETFYFQEKKSDLDTLEIEDALKINPNNIQARTHLALIYLRQLKIEKAEKELTAILKISPTHFPALLHLANLAADAKNYDQALTYCNQILSQDPENVAIMYNRAVALSAKGEIEKAITQFQHILEIDPENQHVIAAIKELQGNDIIPMA